MKPDTRTVRQLFELDVRYLVPLYQRPYVWDAEHQWQPLWEDIEVILEHRLDGGGDAFSHFLGAIVLEQELHAPGAIPVFTVIDGQQRLTTLQLLLGSASRVAASEGAEREALILRKLTQNDELTAEGVELYKVWPTNANRDAFKAVMEPGGPPATREDDPNNRIDEAYEFFGRAISSWLADSGTPDEDLERLKELRVTLTDLLKVVSITLEPGDNAQIIFETLNARGTPLLALDLVKNAVFHAAARQNVDIDSLYQEEWAPELDQPYWRTERRQGRLHRPRADLFLMHWLAMNLREVIPANELFTRFRQRILDAPDRPHAEELIRELRRDAKIMRSFETQAPGSYEALFFERLEILDTSVVLPVVLLLFRDSRVSGERRRRALRVLESWLVRRSLMGLTTKNYNQQVPVMLSRLWDDAEHADDVLLDYLRSGEGAISRWPTDEELSEFLVTRPLYGSVAGKRVVMALAAVEQSLYTSEVDIPTIPMSLSLEHILPQSWEDHWPLPDDGDPMELRNRRGQYLHRLGNLTLVAAPLNSKLSNAAWTQKQDALNAKTRLILNVELINDYPETFDEDAIDQRGARLAERICAIWPGPDGWDDEAQHAPPATHRTGALATEAVLVGQRFATAGREALDDIDIDRWVDVLSAAAPGGTVEVIQARNWGPRARVELVGAETVRHAYMDVDLRDEIPLRLYPGDTLEQARMLYSDPLRCERLLALRDAGWQIEPNFHFGFMTRGLIWTRSALSVDDYVAYWIKRIGETSAFRRTHWDAELQRLIDDGIFDPADEPQFTADFRATARDSASPRPALVATRRWSITVGDDPGFSVQVREALREILLALGEPLHVIAEGASTESDSPAAASYGGPEILSPGD